MSDGAEALQAYDAHPFDGNILDLGIPEPDGFEELRKIRQRDATTPFLMVTASGTKEQAVQAVSTGAQANVLIPFDLTQLQEGIGASTLPRGSGASLRASLKQAVRPVGALFTNAHGS